MGNICGGGKPKENSQENQLSLAPIARKPVQTPVSTTNSTPLTVTETILNREKMGENFKLQLRQKLLKSSIPCGTPFIKTYQYYIETLNSLRQGDLETKVAQVHEKRFQDFKQRAQEVESFEKLLVFTENNYKHDALQLAAIVSIQDLVSLHKGDYFDDKLFVGYLKLIVGMNEVAIEMNKQQSQMALLEQNQLPNWMKTTSNLKPVIVANTPEWDGKQFICEKISEEVKTSNCDILFPIFLTAERMAVLLYFERQEFRITIYAASQYETENNKSIELPETDLINAADHAFEYDVPSNNIIEKLSDYAFDYLSQIVEKLEDLLKAEQFIIAEVPKEEDVLVYLCSVAERLVFKQKIHEKTPDNHCEPGQKLIQLQRHKMVASFMQFFS